MKKKLKLGLLFGGTSAEREVSLVSGSTAAGFLDKQKYDVIPVEIAQDGSWRTDTKAIADVCRKLKTGRTDIREYLPLFGKTKKSLDVALLILHGPGGEDGTVQGVLEMLKIPYTGSKVLASALAMDKAKTKRIAASIGIPVPDGRVLRKSAADSLKNLESIDSVNGKVVIKPNRMGSSIGVVITDRKPEMKKALHEAFRHDDEIIIEEFCEGREITIPVLGNEDPQALPPIEIIPWKKSSFYDYSAKYKNGGSEHIIPADLTKTQLETLKRYACSIHAALGCRGVTRSDFILDRRGKFRFLEINTIPGMTPTSLVPQSAASVGISYPQLLDKLISLAIN